MALTESERHELIHLARAHMGERLAELLMRSIHPEPHRLATKDDVALLGADLHTEMAGLGAELRTEMAQLRTEMAELRADVTQTVSAAITTQTRTLLIGLIVAIVASNLATIVT